MALTLMDWIAAIFLVLGLFILSLAIDRWAED